MEPPSVMKGSSSCLEPYYFCRSDKDKLLIHYWVVLAREAYIIVSGIEIVELSIKVISLLVWAGVNF